MSELEAFSNLPDISFIDGISIEKLSQEAINDFEDKYKELTGEHKILHNADPMKILINSFVLQLYQGYQYINRNGKKNMLRYADEAYLDHIGALRGILRLPPSYAEVTLRFTVSEIQTGIIAIPKGTRATTGDNIFFATEKYAEIPAGEYTMDIKAICSKEGEIGNQYKVNKINIMADPIAYIKSVTNTTISSGGSDAESDKNFSERIYLAPSGYSVAGPKDAYIYWTKTYSQLITDVRVETIKPGDVDIRVILVGGEMPDSVFLEGLKEYLNSSNIKPLTDNVFVEQPDIVEYDVNLTYYIRVCNLSQSKLIQESVDRAVYKYILWQKEAIGRDINPSELVRLVMDAGVKRVDVTKPNFVDIKNTDIGICSTVNVVYGGGEDD